MLFSRDKNFLASALFTVLLCLVGSPLRASEKKAEGGGGGGGEHGAPQEAKLPKDQKEFEDKTSKLNYMSSLIEEANKEFEHLVHQKEHAKTQDEKQEVIREMVDLVNRRNKNIEIYNKLRTELDLRYPNKGQRLNRRYQPRAKQSVDEMESARGLEQLLTHTKMQVDKKYESFNPQKSDEEQKALKAHAQEAPEPHRLRLEK